MGAKQNLALIRLLASQPMLTEAEARRELGLPEPPPDAEDRHDRQNDTHPEDQAVNSTNRPASVA